MIPVVLVPGLLCTAEVFAPQIAALWPYGPVTVASTLEGKTIPEMAAAIISAAPPRFALAGMSMGGYISFEILRQAPQRVIKLALLNTSARPDTREQIAQRRVLVARARACDYKVFLAVAFSSMQHPAHRKNPLLRDINIRMGTTVGIEAMARQTEAIIGRIDSRPTLATVSIPTLVLVGDSDPLTPPDRAHEIAAAIPNARLVVIPECGHESTLEQPMAVNQALIDWIIG